jgi:hypothetical protein
MPTKHYRRSWKCSSRLLYRLFSLAPPESMEQALRGVALSLLDVADQVAQLVTTFGSDLAYRLRKPPAAEESAEPDEE